MSQSNPSTPDGTTADSPTTPASDIPTDGKRKREELEEKIACLLDRRVKAAKKRVLCPSKAVWAKGQRRTPQAKIRSVIVLQDGTPPNLGPSAVMPYTLVEKADLTFPSDCDPLELVATYVDQKTNREIKGDLVFLLCKSGLLRRVSPASAAEFLETYHKRNQVVYVVAPAPALACARCMKIPQHDPLEIRGKPFEEFYICSLCAGDTTFEPVAPSFLLPKVDWCDDCHGHVFRDKPDDCINPYNLAGCTFQICTSCVGKRFEVSPIWAEKLDATGIGLPAKKSYIVPAPPTQL